MKYGELSLGQIEALVNKLGGISGVFRILSGRDKLPFSHNKIWRTIRVGIGPKNPDDFLQALEAIGYSADVFVLEVMRTHNLQFSSTEREVDLVIVSSQELGFKDHTSYETIRRRAKELGWELCPPEVGLQLRLQYLNQPKDEMLLIGMEPLSSEHTHDMVFSLNNTRDLGTWLHVQGVGYPVVKPPETLWVFVQPRMAKVS